MANNVARANSTLSKPLDQLERTTAHSERIGNMTADKSQEQCCAKVPHVRQIKAKKHMSMELRVSCFLSISQDTL